MATIEQQRAMAMARARLRLQEQEVQPQPKEDPYSFENIAGAATEPLMTMGSGVLATPISGLAGLGTMAANVFREEDKDPAETVRSVQESMIYKPKTSGGQTALEAISYPFKKYAEGTEALGKQVTEREVKRGDSPEIAAAKGTFTKTALDVIPMILGAKAMKGKPTFPKVEKVIKETVKAPVKLVGQALHAGKEAVSHRLPGGRERAMTDILVDIAGPKQEAIVGALMKAKPGETAGQAAVGAGSTEFSALAKMLQKYDPTGYRDIIKQQHYGRLKSLKKIGKTPQKLKTAEALMKRHAEEGYGKVRKDVIDPRTGREKLIEAAVKAQEKAKGAEASKIEALRDWGRFKTLESQQAARGKKFTQVPGYPRVPSKYAPQTAVSKEAAKAATEASKIAQKRLSVEKTMSDVNETMLLNTLGEKGVEFGTFLSRPSVRKAIRAAKKSADETGSYFPRSPDDKFSVANLQRIKRAIAENMEKQKGVGTLGKTEQAEIQGTLKSFTNWLREKSTGFAKAEDMFAQEVKHVNRMKIGQAFAKKLKPLIGSKERAAQFTNAYENASKLIKDETGSYVPIEKILKPKQLNVLKRAKKAVSRDVELKEQAALGTERMNEIVGSMYDIPKAHILKTVIVVLNAILKRIEGRNAKITLTDMANRFKSPEEVLKIYKAAKPAEAKLLKSLDPEMVAGMIVTLEQEK